MKHIIGIVGTNSKKSTNRKLLKYIQKHFADQAEIELLEIRDYPIFTKPEDKTLPNIVEEDAKKSSKRMRLLLVLQNIIIPLLLH